jgi:hypothetical protein
MQSNSEILLKPRAATAYKLFIPDTNIASIDCVRVWGHPLDRFDLLHDSVARLDGIVSD